MRKLVILFYFLLDSFIFVSAQTITVQLSGTVSADSTGAPISNHGVTIRAGNANGFDYHVTLQTNVNGTYNCTIQNVPVSPATTFYVSLADCNNITILKSFIGSTSPAVVNFVICAQPTICEASFISWHDSTYALDYQFHSLSSSPAGTSISTYDWDFGDNTTHGTTKDPWHTYANDGLYNVCLFITTSNGCTNTKCQQIQVQQVVCEASFEFQIDSANNKKYHFINHSFIPAGSTITSQIWNFGDGTENDTTSAPWHTFAVDYVYKVCLTTTTNIGCTNTKCLEFQVGKPSSYIRFRFTADSVNLKKIHFFNTSSIVPGVSITSRSWDFGDASDIATTNDPWHTFPTAGTYTVRFTITLSDGHLFWMEKWVHVSAETANCESWFTYAQDGLSLRFDGHANYPNHFTWLWNFGDSASMNNTSSLQSPSHLYSTPGRYHIILNTIDLTGCEYHNENDLTIPMSFRILGNINAGNNPVDHCSIQLIKVDLNNVMTIVDSQIVENLEGLYWFDGLQTGRYFLKAELLPNSVYYGQYAPTYYKEALNWTGATLIELGNSQDNYDFGLKHISGGGSGNGNVNGIITQSGKANTAIASVANVEVLLFDSQNSAISYTTTDASGHFEFSNIAFGIYTIWPEIAGLTTMPAVISLDATTPSMNLPFSIINNNIVYETSDSLQENIIQAGDIFPNPLVKNNAKILISATEDLTIDLNVYNQMGQKINTTQASIVKGKNLTNVEIENLSKGNYFLVISSSKGGSVIRKFTVTK